MPKKNATAVKADLTWAYPPLERGVALSSDGAQLAQFERTDEPNHSWRCTRSYTLLPFEAFDLLALWLYDGEGQLSWVAQLADSPGASDVPAYLVHVNNRGVRRRLRPNLRYVRWVALSSWLDPPSGPLNEEAETAEGVGWTALTVSNAATP